jgi:hypothetical protein
MAIMPSQNRAPRFGNAEHRIEEQQELVRMALEDIEREVDSVVRQPVQKAVFHVVVLPERGELVEAALDLDIRLRGDAVCHRAGEGAQWPQDLLAFRTVAGPEDLHRKDRSFRRADQSRLAEEFDRPAREIVAEVTQDVARLRHWPVEIAGQDDGIHPVNPVLDRCHDAEIAATPSQPPQQVCVFVLGRPLEMAVRRHEVEGESVVAGEPEAPPESSEAAAQCEARGAGMRDGARGRREAEGSALVIEEAER